MLHPPLSTGSMLARRCTTVPQSICWKSTLKPIFCSMSAVTWHSGAIAAKSLGLSTTAEGVETHEQLARLRELGCTEVQGFYVGAAVAADDAARVILHDRPTLASVA